MSALPKLPRGTPATAAKATAPAARWATPDELAGRAWTYAPGRIFLGRAGGQLIGVEDDRHVVTVAGSRSGKSKSLIIPNLSLYPGSAFVIDPKGELAEQTAAQRAAMGHAVYVLDPFGEVTGTAAPFRSAFNPLSFLQRADRSDVPDDVALVTEALILESGGDSHWTDSAKTMIAGMLLWMIDTAAGPNLNRLRELLRMPLSGEEDGDQIWLSTIFKTMAASDQFNGIVAGTGAAMASKTENELRSVLSTANTQTRFLDGKIADVLGRSDFSLSWLKSHPEGRPMTIYLVLPASRMATHSRWFRLMVSLTLAALERDKTMPRHAVLLVLEEFAQLGHMRQIEAAAGLIAGYGVKLWTVLQDLTQIKALYRDSWETFLGNAGLVTCFGNSDATTLDYVSRRLGTISIRESNNVPTTSAMLGHGDDGTRSQVKSVPLLAPFEVALQFGRSTDMQLVMVPDRVPAAIERVWFDDKQLADEIASIVK